MKREILDQLKTSVGYMESCLQISNFAINITPDDIQEVKEDIARTQELIGKIEDQEVFILTGQELVSMKDEAYEKGAIDEYKAGL